MLATNIIQMETKKILRGHDEINKMKEIDKWLEQFRKIWENRFNELNNLIPWQIWKPSFKWE